MRAPNPWYSIMISNDKDMRSWVHSSASMRRSCNRRDALFGVEARISAMRAWCLAASDGGVVLVVEGGGGGILIFFLGGGFFSPALCRGEILALIEERKCCEVCG